MEQSDAKNIRWPKYTDPEAGDRYLFIAEKAGETFSGSALLDNSKKVTEQDLELIKQFHQKVSPVNPEHPWRLTTEQKSLDKGEIIDVSTFANWEMPGGPLEHIHLAMEAAKFVTEELKQSLKPEDEIKEDWAKTQLKVFDKLDPYLVAASAGLHDEGREVTHEFWTNDLIGNRLAKRIGLRRDIVDMMPKEEVMFTPPDKSMDQVFGDMPTAAVIIRIADEFGKRKPGTNRTLIRSDYDPKQQIEWGERYKQRPFSGRPSDRKMKENMDLHNANAPRYFEAIDNWLRAITTYDLQTLSQRISAELSPKLAELPAKS